MGITFKNSLPKITGDVRLEVATPTYSGKKSSDLNDSINPYTSAGPGVAGAGLTEEEINTVRNPSTSADPFFNDVVFVTSFDGTVGTSTFVDSSNAGKTITNNNTVQRSNAITPKFGGASAFFNGTTQSLQVDFDTDFNFNSGEDYTIEFWIYSISGRTAMGLGEYTLSDAILPNNGIFWIQDLGTMPGSGAFVYRQPNSTGATFFNRGGTSVLNQWRHVAISRESGTGKLFHDGVQQSTDIIHSGGPIGGGLYIGSAEIHSAQQTPGFFQQCYIQEVRITKNVARYTSNFTPPTDPFPLS